MATLGDHGFADDQMEGVTGSGVSAAGISAAGIGAAGKRRVKKGIENIRKGREGK